MSTYLYDDQHVSNGDCGDYRDGSSMWVIHNKDDTWRGFKWGPKHYEAIEMIAGEQLDVTVEVTFGTNDLLPSDYSLVVWATEEPVSITVSNHSGNSEHFPTYKMSENVSVYDFNGNLI